jgi:hypothetical protein
MSGMVSAMLWLVRDYWQSFAAFCVFALFHSFGAREPFKSALARWTSPFFVAHFWRLFYCLISILWYYEFIGMLHWGLHPDNDFWLMDYPDGLWQTITAIHLGSIALIYAAFLQSDYLEFMGLKQAWRGGMVWLGLPQPRWYLKQFGTRCLENPRRLRLDATSNARRRLAFPHDEQAVGQQSCDHTDVRALHVYRRPL